MLIFKGKYLLRYFWAFVKTLMDFFRIAEKDACLLVVDKLVRVEQAAADLGTTLPSPFSTLSFLALPVIPELRLTDLGLVDVNQFRLIK